MSLVIGVDSQAHFSPAQDFFGFFPLLLHVLSFVLLLVNIKRVAQGKNQMGKLAVFQPCDHLLYFVM